MPVFVVENRTHGNVGFCNFYEGKEPRRLNYGCYDEGVHERLLHVNTVLAPVVGEAIRRRGGIALKPLIARALRMGDEVHSRNAAASILFNREILPAVLDMVDDRVPGVRETMLHLAENDYFFLRLSMAAAKASADAMVVPGSTLVSAMAFSCRGFAIKLAGLGETWFEGPPPIHQGKLFAGHTEDEITWMGGESPITETIGLGGFAQACALSLQEYQGGSPDVMIERNLEMYAITHGENSTYRIPHFSFRGTPTGIDARKVLETGVLPVMDVGLAGRDGGQIGAGIIRAPRECFADALAEHERQVRRVMTRTRPRKSLPLTFGGGDAVVTGAASGIGAAIARTLMSAGIRTVRVDLRAPEPEPAFAAELQVGVAADVRDPDLMAKLAQAGAPTEGISYLVNCAGIIDNTGFSGVDRQAWLRVLEINLVGAYNLIDALSPALRAATHAAIVNITSIEASRVIALSDPDPTPQYAASKAGLHMLTQTAARALAADGVRVNSISPGIRRHTDGRRARGHHGAAARARRARSRGAVRRPRRHRGCRGVPAQRPGRLHHGNRPPRRRRIPADMSTSATEQRPTGPLVVAHEPSLGRLARTGTLEELAKGTFRSAAEHARRRTIRGRGRPGRDLRCRGAGTARDLRDLARGDARLDQRTRGRRGRDRGRP